MNANDISPFTEAAFRFGPFFFAVFCVFTAWSLRRNKALSAIFAVTAVASMALASWAWWVLLDRVFVYEVVFTTEQMGNGPSIGKQARLFAYNDRRVWHKGPPQSVDEGGISALSFEGIVVSPNPFSSDETFQFDLVWSFPGAGDPVPTRDRICVKYDGKKRRAIPLTVAADPNGQGFHIVGGGECGGDRQARAWSLTGTAWAQEPSALRSSASTTSDPSSLRALSKEELIEMLMQRSRESVAAPTDETPTTIVYYQKGADGGKVEEALRKVNLPVAFRRSAFGGAPSNALWFGEDVDRRQAIEVATKLVEMGIRLQQFGPFERAGSKTNLIEIGSSGASTERPALTVADLSPVGGQ
jgi:hypothetical protein